MTHDGLAARHGRHTRQRILREARRLFAQHGYADASMSGVAHAVGCSKAAIYYHFANKRALYEAVLAAARLSGGGDDPAPAHPPASIRSLNDVAAALEAAIARYFDVECGHREAAMIRRSVEARRARGKDLTPLAGEVRAVLLAGRARGVIDLDADLEDAAVAIAATCDGHIDDWLFGGRAPTKDLPRRLAGLVLHGVAAT